MRQAVSFSRFGGLPIRTALPRSGVFPVFKIDIGWDYPMHPSVKRLLGAVLLIATVGASSVMAVRAHGADTERPPAHSATLEVPHGG